MAGGQEMAQALWYVAPGRAEIRAEPMVSPADGTVRVRTLHSALSRGTEALIFKGGVPEGEYRRMRAPFMGGDFPFPVKYGYANVGRVEAGPPDLAGKAVFTLYPHQSLFDVPLNAVLPLSEAVPPSRGVLGANMETALNAVWDVEPGQFRTVAVVGAGVLGMLAGYLFSRLTSADVTLVDIDPARAGIARDLSLRFALPEAAPADRDLVVHTSASASGLKTALELAGDEATVLELSWYGAGDVPVPLGGAFHSRRLRLISSQVGKVAPSHRATWTHRQRLAAALEFLADDRLDALLAPPIRFADLPARLPDILAPGSGVLCQRIDYT